MVTESPLCSIASTVHGHDYSLSWLYYDMKTFINPSFSPSAPVPTSITYWHCVCQVPLFSHGHESPSLTDPHTANHSMVTMYLPYSSQSRLSQTPWFCFLCKLLSLRHFVTVIKNGLTHVISLKCDCLYKYKIHPTFWFGTKKNVKISLIIFILSLYSNDNILVFQFK
jgi:hypothetical protein